MDKIKRTDTITMAHGSGGRASQELVENLFKPAFANHFLDELHDGAILPEIQGRLAFSTDSYVIHPLFFPGGNIGDLAINGTVNDLAMCGAKPLYLSVGMILEEGLLISDLQNVVQSMSLAATKAGVQIVTGDTKVVERGQADGLYLNTTGVGQIKDNVSISPTKAQVGDLILINGQIAEHGMAIMVTRGGLDFETTLTSDSASLNYLVENILDISDQIHVLRDPTRGGVAAVLNEIAVASQLGILLDESKIPVSESVKTACSLLGFDPLYVANEGKMLAFVGAQDAEKILSTLRKSPEGKDSTIIGRVVAENPGRVLLETTIGTTRIIDMPAGEQLPRIC
jgi:hydrogenase expression/formation protein HypE